jgi:hypothetical protein
MNKNDTASQATRMDGYRSAGPAKVLDAAVRWVPLVVALNSIHPVATVGAALVRLIVSAL